ncbi:MAG: O-antigen ligase family protein [Bacteroidota bacterium]
MESAVWRERPLLALGWLLVFALFPLGHTSLGILVLICDQVQQIARRKGKYFENLPLGASVPLFLAYVLAISPFSVKPSVAVPLSIAYALVFLGAFYGARDLAGHLDFVKKTLLPVMIGGAVAASLVAYFQFLVQHVERAGTLWTACNGFGTLLIMSTPLALAYFAERPQRAARYWSIAYLAFSVGALLITFSRGAWLGFLLALTLYSVAGQLERAWGRIAAVGGCFALILFLMPAVRHRFLTIFSLKFNDIRLVVWTAALKMMKDHPWFGVGAGVYYHVFRRYVPVSVSPAVEAYAHNLFLNIWSEMGLVGLVLFLPILVKALRSAGRLATTGDPFFRALFAALAGVLLHQMVDVPIYGAQIGGAFWGLVGLSAAFGSFDSKHSRAGSWNTLAK